MGTKVKKVKKKTVKRAQQAKRATKVKRTTGVTRARVATPASPIFRAKDKRRLRAMGVDPKAISVSLNLEVNPALPIHTWSAKRGKSNLVVDELVLATLSRKSKRVAIAKGGHLRLLYQGHGRAAGHGLILQFNVVGASGSAVTYWEVQHGATGRRHHTAEQFPGEDLYVLLDPSSAVGSKGRVEKITLALPKREAFVFSGVRLLAYK